jgi:hypothetical protein
VVIDKNDIVFEGHHKVISMPPERPTSLSNSPRAPTSSVRSTSEGSESLPTGNYVDQKCVDCVPNPATTNLTSTDVDDESNTITSSTMPTTIYAERAKNLLNNLIFLDVFSTVTDDSGDFEFSFPWKVKKTLSLPPS